MRHLLTPFGRLELLIALALFATLVGLYGLVLIARAARTGDSRARRFGIALTVPLAVLALCLAWAHFVEPDLLEVTHLELRTDKLPAGTRVRIAQISDLHLDSPGAVDARLPAAIAHEAPDLVIFTGDAADSAEGVERFRTLLASLPARLGRFAVRGNHGRGWRSDQLFGGGAAVELDGQPVALLGGRLWLCGARFGQPRRLRECLEQAGPGFHLVAFHTPDAVESIAKLSPDLYLAGHTHGGQVRLPLYGAVITFSAFDKKYEMGRYQVGHTTLYVNRGIGTESGAPRLRFLCRPEVTVIDLIGTAGQP